MTKKYQIAIILMVAMALSAASCIRIISEDSYGGIILIGTDLGDNNVKEITLDGNFTSISNRSPIDIEYSQGPLKAELQVPGKLLDYIKVEVSDERLSISIVDSIRIRGSYKAKLIVSSPSISGIVTYTSGDIKVNDLENVKLSLKNYGSGDISVADVNGKSVSAGNYGSGDISVRNLKCESVYASTSGSGDIAINIIESGKASIESKGSGDVAIDTLQSANVDISTLGSGNILVRNVETLKLNAKTLGSGDIKLIRGRVGYADLKSTGSGDILMRNVKTDNVTKTNKGSGSIKTK